MLHGLTPQWLSKTLSFAVPLYPYTAMTSCQANWLSEEELLFTNSICHLNPDTVRT